jgi:S-adenosylmethionine decarboxylase
MGCDDSQILVSETNNGFEGVEKKLEIIFDPKNANTTLSDTTFGEAAGNVPKVGLRRISASTWSELLAVARCSILDSDSNDYFDSYILSESSLFVYSYHIMIKTCGRTVPLLMVPYLLVVAERCCNLPASCLSAIRYSRKNFLYPQDQPWPHSSWQHEIVALDSVVRISQSPPLDESTTTTATTTSGGSLKKKEKAAPTAAVSAETGSQTQTLPPISILADLPPSMFEVSAFSARESDGQLQALFGSPFVFGNAASECWHLWTHKFGAQPVPSPSLSSLPSTSTVMATLEVMMHALPPQVTDVFHDTHPAFTTVESVMAASRLQSCLAPSATYKGALFHPCGFSLNAMHNECYTTVHVTPESDCSFASFECSFPHPTAGGQFDIRAVSDMLSTVLATFQPGRFSAALVLPPDSPLQQDEYHFQFRPNKDVREGWTVTHRTASDIHDGTGVSVLHAR